MWCDNSEILAQMVETVKRLKWFNLIRLSTGNYSQTRWTNCFSRRTTDIHYSSRYRKQIEEDSSYSQRENDTTTFERSSSQVQLTLIKAIALPEVQRKNGFKIKQSYELGRGDPFRWDSHSCRYSERIGMELARKKLAVIHSRKMNIWSCFASRRFGRIVCFKKNSNAELMCDICKCSLLPKARNNLVSIRQSGNGKNITTPNTSGKYHWTGNQVIESKNWLTLDVTWFCTYWKCLAASQDEIKKKKLTNCGSLISSIQRECKSLSLDLATTLVHSMNKRISRVIKSDGDFILSWWSECTIRFYTMKIFLILLLLLIIFI